MTRRLDDGVEQAAALDLAPPADPIATDAVKYRNRYRSRFALRQRSPAQPTPYVQLESVPQARIVGSKQNKRPVQRILSPLPLVFAPSSCDGSATNTLVRLLVLLVAESLR